MRSHLLFTILTIVHLGCENSDGDGDSSTSSDTTSTSSSATTMSDLTTSSEPATTDGGPECGNAVLESDEECDYGQQNGPGNTCLANCFLNVCGDGDVLVGVEACDDGNTSSDDGCSAECTLESACANSFLVNPDFEDGILDPWTTNGDAGVTMDGPHTGSWSAHTTGNVYIDQTFSPVPTEKITNASFWSWHDATDKPLVLVEWYYGDESYEQRLIQMPLDGWQEHDILDDLDAGKTLAQIRVWGYASASPGPDVAKFDNFNFCAVK